MKDLETFIDEVSAIIEKQTFLELYQTAASEPYSFLYVKLTARDRNEMFFELVDKLPIIVNAWFQTTKRI